MNKSDTIGALAAALSKAQGQMTFASKDASNPHFRAKYADLAAIVDAIRGPLSSNGLSFSQLCDFTDNGGLIIETLLMHESGEWIAGRMQMPVPKNDPQGIGSATTYGKRYCLAAIVGIAADEDDDGEAAMGRGQQKQQQKQTPPKESQPRQLSEAQTKYLPRVKTALDALHGSDVAAKKATIKAQTAMPAKGNFPAREGVEDYRTLDGKPLEILAHNLEKMVKEKAPDMCNECRQPVNNHAPSCPLATPPQ